MIAKIISNGTYFICISNWNTTSDVFEEFLNNLKKYLASKKYFTNWRFSIILDNATYHNTKQIYKKLEEITTNVWFLPAYTPKFQPVEIFFCIVKCKLIELKLNNVIKLDWREGENLIKSTLRSMDHSTIIKCFKKAIVNIQEVLK